MLKLRLACCSPVQVPSWWFEIFREKLRVQLDRDVTMCISADNQAGNAAMWIPTVSSRVVKISVSESQSAAEEPRERLNEDKRCLRYVVRCLLTVLASV